MNKIKNTYRGVVGLIVLAALLISLFDQLTATTIPTIGGRFLGYISYFTELSNILVMLWYFNRVFFKKKIKFLNKDSVRGAITLYIWVAGIVFFLVLNQAWHAHGIVKLEEYTLHGFSPLAFLLDYFLFEKKGIYKFKEVLKWIIFPILYLFYAIGIGHIIHVYPYPFLNMNVLTVGDLIQNLIHLLIPAFIGLGLLIVIIDKLSVVITKVGSKSRDNNSVRSM
ncbi:MAG: Pr6Pr family membrane protein [Sarcina sp.]